MQYAGRLRGELLRVDVLVEIASKQVGCYGARITGGRFGDAR